MLIYYYDSKFNFIDREEEAKSWIGKTIKNIHNGCIFTIKDVRPGRCGKYWTAFCQNEDKTRWNITLGLLLDGIDSGRRIVIKD